MQGMELILDATARGGLNDLELCDRFITNIITMVGMTELERFRVELSAAMDSGPGISITSVILESHIALHTWPEYHTLMFNIVSCKPFDCYRVRDALTGTFAAAITQQHVILRTVQTTDAHHPR